MRKIVVFLFLFFISFKFFGQEVILPEDFRQHNLTQFNASLWNATYALDWNKPKSISLWTRWQWQTVDTDPTSLFVNYTHDFTSKTAASIGFLQNNTGTFLNTGGVLNFAHSISIQENINLVVGTNVYLFQQEIADDRFNASVSDIAIDAENDFIAQFSPGIRLNIDDFNLALSLENTFDYNFSRTESISNSKVFVGVVSNDFPVTLFPSIDNNFVRPLVYLKTIPNADTQYGANVLFSTAKFWVQGGYNSFYGPSGGLGATLFNKLSIGGLVEFGASELLSNQDPTFELVASYHFGKSKEAKEILADEIEEVEEDPITEVEESQEINEEDIKTDEDERTQAIEAAEKEKIKKNKEAEKLKKEALKKEKNLAKQTNKLSKKELRKEKARAKQEAIRLKQEKEKQQIVAEQELERLKQEEQAEKLKNETLVKEKAKAKQDSIALQAQKEAELLKEKRRQDSIVAIEQTRKVDVLPGEKYEEVANTSIDGLAPGFYLIANVFGTKKYFDAFMKDMTNKGLNPGSFYRSKNKYNYVYLGKYNTIEEARKARNSNLNGSYTGKTWIFRVKGN